jgi:PhnB protein
MKIEPYLFFGGTCAQAFAYYQQHLGATDLMVFPFRGSPAEKDIPAEYLDSTMHASLKLDGQTIMGSDGMPGEPPERMQGAFLSISVDSDAEAKRVFDALSAGGHVIQPLQVTFYASSFAMLTDQFGINWMVMCEGGRQAGA